MCSIHVGAAKVIIQGSHGALPGRAPIAGNPRVVQFLKDHTGGSTKESAA
jgi:hypothetical protein